MAKKPSEAEIIAEVRAGIAAFNAEYSWVQAQMPEEIEIDGRKVKVGENGEKASA